ncbi:phage tail protein [Metapseudomonas otitidis]
METFDFPVLVGASGEVRQAVLENRFGDGYVQRIGVGLNNQSQQWSVSVTGTFGQRNDIAPVRAFLDRHQGWRSFLWTPPGGEQGLYIANGYRTRAQGNGVFTLSWIFEQSFHP